MKQEQYPATYYDGQSAVKQTVTLEIDRITMVVRILSQAGGVLVEWPFDDLRRVREVADNSLQLFRAGDDTAARIVIAHRQAKAIIETIAQDLDSRDMTGVIWRKIALWTGGAVVAVLLMVFVIVPALAASLAPLIPPEKEAAIGKSALRQIEWLFSEDGNGETGSWFCKSPAGVAALAEMTARIKGSYDIPYPLEVRVVNHDMINAFALPGGQVVLMKGLLDAADNAEQVAGVLGHELGHVANRDPIEQALRAGGSAGLLSLLVGDVTGGTAFALIGDQLVNSSYSRAAESKADVFALERMAAANLDPAAFAGFFDLLIEEMGDHGDMEHMMAWVSTHPMSQGRADAARAAVVEGRTYDPVLTNSEWNALRNICD